MNVDANLEKFFSNFSFGNIRKNIMKIDQASLNIGDKSISIGNYKTANYSYFLNLNNLKKLNDSEVDLR